MSKSKNALSLSSLLTFTPKKNLNPYWACYRKGNSTRTALLGCVHEHCLSENLYNFMWYIFIWILISIFINLYFYSIDIHNLYLIYCSRSVRKEPSISTNFTFKFIHIWSRLSTHVENFVTVFQKDFPFDKSNFTSIASKQFSNWINWKYSFRNFV